MLRPRIPARGGIAVEIPGRGPLHLSRLLLDMNGTFTASGRLLPGVGPRLRRLALKLEIAVLTADTFGTAARTVATLPVTLETIHDGRDKARVAGSGDGIVAIGNGRNDVAMLRRAALGIAVVGPEGAAAPLLGVADVVVTRIEDALDLLVDPRRLVATLRQ